MAETVQLVEAMPSAIEKEEEPDAEEPTVMPLEEEAGERDAVDEKKAVVEHVTVLAVEEAPFKEVTEEVCRSCGKRNNAG